MSNQSPYAQAGHKLFSKPPTATLSAHNYIFSENTSIHGVWLLARNKRAEHLPPVLSWVRRRLRSGHADFLDALFMNTRGGVSKAWKGLHLRRYVRRHERVWLWRSDQALWVLPMRQGS